MTLLPSNKPRINGRIDDSSFILAMCKPFACNGIQYESFCLDFVKTELIPQITNAIRNGNASNFKVIPKLTCFIVEYFGQEGYILIQQSIFSEIISAIKTLNEQLKEMYVKLYTDILAKLKDVCKEDLINEHAHLLLASNDSADRELAAYIIPMIDSKDLIKQYLTSLSFDRIVSVRVAVLKSIENNTFDEETIKYIVLNAINDKADDVKMYSAYIFAKVAPSSLDQFNKILLREDIGRCAIAGVSKMASIHGIQAIYESFSQAAKLYPDESSLALLEMSKSVTQETETYLIELAKILIKHVPFVWHLHEFAKKFTNREPFVELLSPNKAKHWRLRNVLQKQVILFASEFRDKLIPYAMRFSGDLVAAVRDESVFVWLAMLDNARDQAVEKIRWLATCGWRQRLIVSKVITADNKINPEFQDIAVTFSKDKVRNVRFCLANRLVGTTDFEALFAHTDDPDILSLIRNN